MRENLIFYGIGETENHEAGLYSEEVLKNFFEKELEIDTFNIELDRVHRMGKPKFRDDGSKLPRPILAKFQCFKQKEQVKRSAVKLKGKNHYGISEQWSHSHWLLLCHTEVIYVIKRFFQM